MKRVTRHIRVATIAILALLVGVFPAYTSAAAPAPNLNMSYASQPDILITELQTNGGSNASQEFVELYNTTDHDIIFGSQPDVAGHVWKLQIFKAAASGSEQSWLAPTNAIELTGTISAHDYLLVTRKGYAPAAVALAGQVEYGSATSNFFIDSGGAIQLVEVLDPAKQQDVVVHSQLQWLPKPLAGSTLPLGIIETPVGGKSSQRMPDDNGEYQNPDGTLASFASADTITPLAAWLPPDPVVSEPSVATEEAAEVGEVADGSGVAVTNEAVDNTGLADPQITEILPNPASPLTDAADEFIELHNPNNAPFDIMGYALEVGTTTLHDFTFTDHTVIPANGYVAFYSVDTKLSLTNSGGQAKLLNPAGVTVSQTEQYSAAADAMSWSQVEGVWQWTTTATPGAVNILTAEAAAAKATAAPSTAKATTAKKAAVTKAKGTTTTKKATAKKTATKKAAKKKTTTKKTTLAAAVVKPKPPIHTAILVAVAAAAVLYGLYEYRHDISNKLRQLRGNRTGRRQNRGEAAWRRSYSTE